MITIRKSAHRGNTQTDWLNSLHTFSFADYYDPQFMGFGTLRVINEDTVKPDNGFGAHAHNNMEIVSYVIEGALEHKDSMGTGSIIKPGEIQRMSAGTGVRHSEFNPSKEAPVHFLQIWIIPEKQQQPPSYEQKTIPKEDNKLILIGSPDGGTNTITIHQNVKLFSAHLTKNNSIQYAFEKNRKGWVQLIKGKITLNAESLSAGDGAAITDENTIQIACAEDTELLMFDLE